MFFLCVCVESPEWVFISMDHTTVNKYHDLNDKDKSFDTGVYTLVMRRKALYPMTMLILPNLILAGLTILVFSVPIAAGKVKYILIFISRIPRQSGVELESYCRWSSPLISVYYCDGLLA